MFLTRHAGPSANRCYWLTEVVVARHLAGINHERKQASVGQTLSSVNLYSLYILCYVKPRSCLVTIHLPRIRTSKCLSQRRSKDPLILAKVRIVVIFIRTFPTTRWSYMRTMHLFPSAYDKVRKRETYIRSQRSELKMNLSTNNAISPNLIITTKLFRRKRRDALIHTTPPSISTPHSH